MINDQQKENKSSLTEEQMREILAPLKELLNNSAETRAISPEMMGNPDFQEVYQSLAVIRELALTLSRGDLSAKMRGQGFVAAHLKALQANLRHLTWQTKRIAQGDLIQRVDFMGDFSDAFNSMVEALAAARVELEELAATDPLTKLANRRSFFDNGQRSMERCRRYGGLLSVFVLDLDHFKKVNDTFGHYGGDQVLVAVAEIFHSCLRSNDLIGRIGGEEFAVILPEENSARATTVAERILTECRNAEIKLEDARIIRFALSIGVAQLRANDQDFGQVIQRADEALYMAKNAGRNQVCCWDK